MVNKGNLYKIIYGITPPFIFSYLKKSSIYPKLQNLTDKYLKKDHHVPSWNVVSAGLLEGKNIFIYPLGAWKDMLNGEYDNFFIDYLKKLDLSGKVVYDIGAHFGYSSMCFAQMVGETGRVVAFEPNSHNLDRFNVNFLKNTDLKKVVDVYDFAVSDKYGEEEFFFNDYVDNGSSSGSFISNSDTFYEKDSYEKNYSYKKTKVKTWAIDSFGEIGINKKPFLVKIDVEGAEYLVLEGAKKMLEDIRPILLIEIHSIFNMLKVGEILNKYNYKVELLKEERDGRCFISAVSNK